MKAFLERWAANEIEHPAGSDKNQAAELKPDPEPESLHYALKGKAILGELYIQPCEVGCDASVKFYNNEGVKYGYCEQCGVYQRIVGL